jgi:hypothetical protein
VVLAAMVAEDQGAELQAVVLPAVMQQQARAAGAAAAAVGLAAVPDLKIISGQTLLVTPTALAAAMAVLVIVVVFQQAQGMAVVTAALA